MNLEPITKALETEGGKILVIIFMLLFIIGAAMLMIETKHPLQESGKELMVGAVTSLLMILYDYLKKKKEN